MHIPTQLIQSYPRDYRWWSSGKEKSWIPLEAHHKAQSSDTFAKFSGKKSKRAVIFLFFGQSCSNCILKLPRSTAFEQRMTCRSAAKKSCGSHLFGVGLGEADKTALVQELSKAITFCLRSYPGEISHSNLAKQELSNDVSLLEVLPRKVALHTSSHLTPIEA